ncbi:ATP-binding protein [Hymenobacter psychrophilus]|uniref:Serine/threonine-protein kinase RsbW n=1 Tax=Hymenobacter psychrophilus TaxID=651662 RepID=A0A1H3KPK5_9BACT|nr:ATP-binding protein [Hymenobacter psychrophilus]SDY53980.1 serine/threonine-protein kinase RsbW [Hymenobacter psychrophilus]
MKQVIRISCNRRNLKVVRDFVSDYLAGQHLSEVLVNQLVLAVDEVVANFIIHANAEDERQFLDVRIDVRDHEFGFEIEDGAPSSYSPGSYQEPDLREFVRVGKKGGVGMMLVNRIMDRVEYSTTGEHTVCRLYKSLT